LHWIPELIEGQSVGAGSCIGVIRGPVRGILSAERIVLNMLCRLSGVASLTRKFVDAVAGTKAKIYDTRKTTPGWRRLEKYAVRCGGGRNHRGGLSEAALIKDNHLAWGKSSADKRKYTPAESVRIVRDYIEEHQKTPFPSSTVIVEVEVDTLEQLQEVLPSDPDIVLLDNMPPAVLREAVALRDRLNAKVELEASGGLDLQTIRAVAESGIERISVGALTHSAPALDIGLDWKE
jgi:nicotinate-nucleotide pyrophosphorylase (carboxylating)